MQKSPLDKYPILPKCHLPVGGRFAALRLRGVILDEQANMPTHRWPVLVLEAWKSGDIWVVILAVLGKIVKLRGGKA